MASGMIKKLAVVGAGQMGGGIAQLLSTAGLEVILVDQKRSQLESASRGIERSLGKLASKDKLKDQPKQIMKRITFSNDIQKQSVSKADFLIEAVSEDEVTKSSVLREADRVASPEAIFASNTSSISITRLAAVTKRPSQVVGMHFMNPVPIMPLIELVRGMATSNATFAETLNLARILGRETIVSQDRPGFIVNRLLMPMINEAFYTMMEGVATAEDIDAGMRLGTSHPMGPLKLADFIGLDTCLSIMRVLHQELGDDKYRPCPVLTQYVDAGWLGKKTGKGVYSYEDK